MNWRAKPAQLVPEAGAAILRTLIHRYLGGEDSAFAAWLLSRAAAEVAIRIEPARLRSWDFTRRMESVAGSAAGWLP